MSQACKGAVDLGGAVGIVTTRKTLGTNPATSAHDVVVLGNQLIPIETAVKMGLMDKSSAGVYTTLQGPQAATRVNA
jgi:hypothetical protein